MNLDSRVFVAGHNGMVGSAIVRQLKSLGYRNIISRSSSELDLTCQQSVQDFFADNQIDQVYLAAAKVGGIHANNVFPADFIYRNLMIESNVIHQAYQNGVEKLLFLGSSCIYPKLAHQPMAEAALLTGLLEPTNEPYAIAKIAGIKLCESYNRQFGVDYRSVMPTNLYGPGDNFHLDNSHVVPALIRRFHEAKLSGAKTVKIWGTGTPKREFLHVDDMAAASVFVMNLGSQEYSGKVTAMNSHINVGTGEDCSILDLAHMIAEVVGFEGAIDTSPDKPDGTPRKLMDVSLLKSLGWQYSIKLRDGLKDSYDWFCQHECDFRGSDS